MADRMKRNEVKTSLEAQVCGRPLWVGTDGGFRLVCSDLGLDGGPWGRPPAGDAGHAPVCVSFGEEPT